MHGLERPRLGVEVQVVQRRQRLGVLRVEDPLADVPLEARFMVREEAGAEGGDAGHADEQPDLSLNLPGVCRGVRRAEQVVLDMIISLLA